MASTISTNLDGSLAAKARVIAQRENRSISNFVAGAVGVFSEFPKELRDTLLELRASNDSTLMKEVMREMTLVVARRRFDAAVEQAVKEARFDPALASVSDIELLDAAAELSKGR